MLFQNIFYIKGIYLSAVKDPPTGINNSLWDVEDIPLQSLLWNWLMILCCNESTFTVSSVYWYSIWSKLIKSWLIHEEYIRPGYRYSNSHVPLQMWHILDFSWTLTVGFEFHTVSKYVLLFVKTHVCVKSYFNWVDTVDWFTSNKFDTHLSLSPSSMREMILTTSSLVKFELLLVWSSILTMH